MTSRAGVPPRRPGAIAVTFLTITALIGALIGAVVGAPAIGLVVGAAVAVGGIIGAYRHGLSVLMRTVDAELATAQTQPRLHNLVDGLCLSAGVSAPQVHVISSEAPNAMVVAVSPGRSAIAVTTALLRDCDRVGLEAVVAHLVARLRSGQAIAGTLSTLLIGAPLLWGERARRRGAAPEAGAAASVLAVLGRVLLATRPLLAPLMGVFVPSRLIAEADQAACLLTRYPPALIAVLDAVHAGSVTGLPVGTVLAAPVVTDHLWFVPAVSDSVAHPPFEERLASLKEI